MLPAVLTALFFSVSIVCAGRATRLVGGTQANFLRLLVATGCLAFYAHLFGQGWAGAGFWLFFVGGVIGIGVGDFATFHALDRIGPRLTVLLVQCLCAPFAALVEWGWLGTVLTAGQLWGGGIILLGTAVSLLPGIRLGEAFRPLVGGTLLATAGAFSQALGAVLTRKAVEANAGQGVVIDGMTSAYQRICGALLIMLVIYPLIQTAAARQQASNGRNPARKPWKKAVPWIVANGVSGLVLGVACFQWALVEMPAAVVLSIVALTPLLVMPLTWIIDRDRPSLVAVAGGIVAVGGVVILKWS